MRRLPFILDELNPSMAVRAFDGVRFGIPFKQRSKGDVQDLCNLLALFDGEVGFTSTGKGNISGSNSQFPCEFSTAYMLLVEYFLQSHSAKVNKENEKSKNNLTNLWDNQRIYLYLPQEVKLLFNKGGKYDKRRCN